MCSSDLGLFCISLSSSQAAEAPERQGPYASGEQHDQQIADAAGDLRRAAAQRDQRRLQPRPDSQQQPEAHHQLDELRPPQGAVLYCMVTSARAASMSPMAM